MSCRIRSLLDEPCAAVEKQIGMGTSSATVTP